MFDKFKARIAEHKSSKKLQKSLQISQLLSVILGGIIGFLVSILTKNFAFFVIILSSSLVISQLLSPYNRNDKELTQLLEKKRIVLSFYDSFLLFSSLTSSFQEGFNQAVSELEISDLKDSLVQYQENSLKGDLPLIITNTRIENDISVSFLALLHDTEEASQTDIDEFNSLLGKYQKEDDTQPSSSLLNYLPWILIFSFLFAVLGFYLTGNV
jgi:phosphate/sulfate permease